MTPFFQKFCKDLTEKDKSGFTLLELLISLAIIGLITSIVVFNQGDFSDQVSLSNVVNEIDLQIREAQAYGISVKEYIPSSNEFNVAYGVDFNLIAGLGGGNTSFISFVDRNPQDGVYGTPTSACVPVSVSTPECLFRFNLSRNNTISNLCVVKSDSTETCYADVTTPIARIDVTFLRPNPGARIAFYNNSGTSVNSTYSGFRGAKIQLRSPKGKTQNVYIYTTGETEIR